tara:strand:- start:2619 stop:3143 length:525 start_codon:yes stop_codon:yes gene_type:complete
MSWNVEIPLIVRSWINDLSDNPTYSDDRIQQLIVVAAQYVTTEINLDNEYTVDITTPTITPDPSTLSTKDIDFIGFVALKSACMLDQSTLRTRAAMEGIKAALGPAQLSVGGNLRGYEVILKEGPCALYDKLRMEYEVGNANGIKAILSPFVGNKFDPTYLRNSAQHHDRDFYT